MRQAADSGIVEWIGMFISILVMLALSFFQKKTPPQGLEEEEVMPPERRRHEEELYDDEEPQREVIQAPVEVKRLSSKVQADVLKRSVYAQAHAKKQAERVLNSNYRLQNALEGFKQRRPLDQRREQNAIEKRTLNTMKVSEFLSVDSDADARKVAHLKKRDENEKSQEVLRKGVIWSEILKPPIALRKGVDVL